MSSSNNTQTKCVSPPNNIVQDYEAISSYEFNGTTINNNHYDEDENVHLSSMSPSPTLNPDNNCHPSSHHHISSLSSNGANGSGKVTTNVPPTANNSIGVQQKDTTFTKIFVGGLPYHTTDDSLRKFFLVYGDIEEAVVITDRQTGKSRGYGFVTMSERGAAERAVKEANPIIDGRKANVNLAYIGAKPRSNSLYGSLYLNGVNNGTSNGTNLNGVNLPLNALYTGLFPIPNGLQQIIYNPLSTQLLGASPYLSSSSNAFTPLLSQQLNGHTQQPQTLINALVNQGTLGPLITPSRLNNNGTNGALSPNGINFLGSPHSAPNSNSHHLVIPYDYAHLNGINSINFLGSPNGCYNMANNEGPNLGIGLHHLNPLESEHLINSGAGAALQHANGINQGSLLLTPPPGTYLNGSHGSANYLGIANGTLRGLNDTSPINASSHHRSSHINFPS